MMFLSRIFLFKHRYRILFSTLIIMTIVILLTFSPESDIRYCFMDQKSMTSPPKDDDTMSTSSSPDSPQRLEDVLNAKVKPSEGRNIFFHETSCPHLSRLKEDFFHGGAPHINLVHLNARQACAVESAAKHNPNFKIFVLFASPVYRDHNISNPILEAVLSYPNVNLRNLNLWTYAAETPLDNWLKDGKLFKSKYVLSHVSDFLRYLSLWRWGGTYLDLDTVTLQSLEDLINFTGAESERNLAAGVMNFAHNGFGHEIAAQCLRDFQRNFNGRDWGTNGPGVITRVMKGVCATESIELMIDSRRCMGFNIFDRNAFYAIPWKDWDHFLEAQYLEKTMQRIESSYVAHVWNKFSQHRRFKVGANVAYGKIAEIHCPKVYKMAGEYF